MFVNIKNIAKYYYCVLGFVLGSSETEENQYLCPLGA